MVKQNMTSTVFKLLKTKHESLHQHENICQIAPFMIVDHTQEDVINIIVLRASDVWRTKVSKIKNNYRSKQKPCSRNAFEENTLKVKAD